ncbi:FecR family protein [Sphingobacterium sp. ML3W]|uniref:FecR family protein n=1 Tax=Sphingobacterium sp. ML3W TaxID=1538644 RepID=UPI00068FE33D|nr:FecR family protein [Sphingobacterium sp. ML3W]
MTNIKTKIIDLLRKPIWSYDEKKWILQYLEEYEDTELRALMHEHFIQDATIEEHHNLEDAKILLDHIHLQITDTSITKKQSIFDSMKRYWSSVAAAIALVSFISYLTWNNQVENIAKTASSASINQEAMTWGKKATLKLSNGTVINLDDLQNGQALTLKGIIIRKTADGTIRYEYNLHNPLANDTPISNTINTPKGGEYQVTLPDGSKVWLNAMSSLTYHIPFAPNNRTVHIEGEAYFEIAKDSKRPFIVHANQVEVKVLGTHFNVSAYASDPEIKTTLLEGSVQISNNALAQRSSPVIMTPGQQAIVSTIKSDPIKLIQIDTADAMSWRNGYFIFHREDIHGVMEKVGRWYDLDIKFKGKLEDRKFEGTISRMESPSTLIKALQLTGIAKFKLEGRTIIVEE